MLNQVETLCSRDRNPAIPPIYELVNMAIEYADLAKICDRWRYSIPSDITDEERRIIWIALVAAKAVRHTRSPAMDLDAEEAIINKA